MVSSSSEKMGFCHGLKEGHNIFMDVIVYVVHQCTSHLVVSRQVKSSHIHCLASCDNDDHRYVGLSGNRVPRKSDG